MTLGGCAAVSQEPEEPPALPVTRWDHRPEAPLWTEATLEALQTHGASLPAFTPADIETWCPGYRTASLEDRQAFWVGLFSALAKHESTWNPAAVGGGGRWFGLVQIDPNTARGYGCRAQSGQALKDGAANLTCAVRIASRQVLNYGNVNRGMRDWGPFHSGSKRAEMQAWTRAQPYCAIES
nr:transglycosylase SLT domain-containing protein [Tranquillimonas alkanivorans]